MKGENDMKDKHNIIQTILNIFIVVFIVSVSFWFKQTGALFEKNGKIYHVPRRHQHSQARKAGLNYCP